MILDFIGGFGIKDAELIGMNTNTAQFVEKQGAKISMITISKSKSADTRSADKPVSKEQLLESSIQHIGDVQRAIIWMIGVLSKVAQNHDFTKLLDIDGFHHDFKTIQEGSKEDFKKMDWFQLHVAVERHHLNDRCPEDVNLFDVLERIADITMAGMGRTGKIYDDNLDVEILKKAYKNTIELLKSQIVVAE